MYNLICIQIFLVTCPSSVLPILFLRKKLLLSATEPARPHMRFMNTNEKLRKFHENTLYTATSDNFKGLRTVLRSLYLTTHWEAFIIYLILFINSRAQSRKTEFYILIGHFFSFLVVPSDLRYLSSLIYCRFKPSKKLFHQASTNNSIDNKKSNMPGQAPFLNQV